MLRSPGADALEDVVAHIKASRSGGAKAPSYVFTNGVFDLVHPGHLRSLRAARALGDYLIVGINSDESVSRLKGPNRPIIPAVERAKILSSFEMVDFVVIFTEDTPLNIVKALQPDVIAKGEDYRGREVVGADVVLAAGGRLEYLPMQAGVSSTDIISRILHAHQRAV